MARDHDLPYSQFQGVNRPGSSWTSRDRALALALKLFEQTLCPGCGWPRGVTMDKVLRRAWSAKIAGRCHACTEIDKRSQGYTTEKGTAAPHALQWSVELAPEGLAYLELAE